MKKQVGSLVLLVVALSLVLAACFPPRPGRVPLPPPGLPRLP